MRVPFDSLSVRAERVRLTDKEREIETGIWWIRRDLRLHDNQALAAAMSAGEQVVPLFILDPQLLGSEYVGWHRLAFLFEGLRRIDADLRSLGSRLIVRRGSPPTVLKNLLEEVGGGRIFAERDYSPYAQRRDQRVEMQLPLESVPGLTVHPLDATLKSDGSPYQVFTPYYRSWMALPVPATSDLLPAPEQLVTPTDLTTESIPESPGQAERFGFEPGERAGWRRLADFTSGSQAPIGGYEDARDRLDQEGTSRLSPYLRFGMISARQAVVAARQAMADVEAGPIRSGAEAWLRQLVWREFYISILAHFPHVRGGSFRQKYDRIEWRNAEDEFEAWCRGKTGYPVVDAAMRQLESTGWMPNRARMIVASFLVKDLLVDWRWGEKWFMQQLLDGDPAANNGGWQWAAGTGTDAAPYFRIFNPALQGKKYDPDGAYVRRWLPELAEVPDRYLHHPWKMPAEIQRRANCEIGADYPAPIVDHKAARERTLAAFAAVKDGDG